MATAIEVQGLGKRYQLGQGTSYRTLRESLVSAATAPMRMVKRLFTSGPNVRPDGPGEAIWALNDVHFNVSHGEVVGIIGRNGAGKSTLLKVLSRITQPTTGRIELMGRVGSLLEVGTGFHPELTGRENIYLNGAILGMRQTEIRSKFDEIVEFSEIGRFLDTPVKRYSSGMYMRLAFAVAAHLEPEILVVDEVLAVGDAAFQNKCLGKMDDVAKQGRTVLFVSHNLAALANICPRSILLVNGSVHRDRPTSDVIAEYIRMGREANGEVIWEDPAKAPGNEKIRLRAVRVISREQTTADVNIDEAIHVQIEYWNYKPGSRASASIHVVDQMGVCAFASISLNSANLIRDEWAGKPHPSGLYRADCTIPGNFLNEGRYSINAFILTDVTQWEAHMNDVVAFTVHESGEMRKEYAGGWIGVVRPKLAWQTEKIGDLQHDFT